ncbi:tudor and KH domain-containing protein homolog isoform X2 [Spodoptera frugiperda]|uniref:Tudor and KH domain-containing protein homolog isoform X2 n=1 Tax=Spodoptera frugiperda TaxID=7108 RepID=A0A9R0DML7_SPOFR|nr:tudor and KH domain-containing protein homolog isoform X2 [Spodoptera frugiperda]
MHNKLIVPVALGLSLVTVTAFVVYYVFKKDEEEEEVKKVKTARMNVIEVSVPKAIVAGLIGRGGSNIKDIEKISGAKVNVKEFSDKDHDICVIRGRTDATQIAETLVHEFINQQPVNIEDTMEVPSWACGRIIGSQGENINSISHRSGARIKISSSGDKTTVRKVMFLGTEEQIKVARDLIENCVAQEKCRREIEQSKRSPRHVQSSSKSPSPTPSATANETTDGASGDSQVQRHVKSKRPENRGAPIEVFVSAVSSPSRFWVQFVGPQVTQLDLLVEEMTEYYGKKENRENHALSHVSVGQVVAAVFRHDGRWYRARVHDIRPNEYDHTQQVADVFFLDYGDSEYVSTYELCELRADLLRLRFQAMECFLAGVRPPNNRETWDTDAIERFETLVHVARWQPLLSKTCTYKKTATAEGEKEREIPGIKLYDNTDNGEYDIGEMLVMEGHADEDPGDKPAAAPNRPPFGDLGSSKVLGMVDGGRSSSVPKDHKDNHDNANDNHDNKDDRMTTSKSLGSGLESGDKLMSISNFDLSYPDNSLAKAVNGSHQNFLQMEKQNLDKEGNVEKGSLDTLVPSSPILSKSPLDEFKANMNRIDSHHSNLEFLAKAQQDNK